MRNRVLIVEDDPKIARLVSIHLQDMGLIPEVESNGQAALDRLGEERYALVVLDIMLPELDGLTVCRKLRATDEETPVLILTAKAEEIDVVLGLELGADDYLTKPFGVRELIARVRALLRRADALARSALVSEDQEVVFDDLVVHRKKRKVTLRGEALELTAKEFDLLECLVSNPGRVYSRSELLEQVWGYRFDGYDHTVNSLINRLRRKIEPDPAHPRYIKTLWGVGYRFAELEDLRT